jgi:hypothetical protein
MEDQRPDPNPRKNPHLWQSYLWRDEMMEMRKRHLLRISSSEAGKSNLDAQFERQMIDHVGMDAMVGDLTKTMVNCGKTLGPIWEWGTSIKGLGEGGLLAQLLAQIDDIGKFDTVSKLWRFAGWAVIDGEIDRCKKGEKSPYNRKLKAICWNIVQSFIRNHTPIYADIYYEEKDRQRHLYPDVVCRECGCVWDDCDNKKKHHKLFNDGHLHNRAIRKTAKIFLQHLWVTWREFEGLPVSQPYAQAIMGHTHIVGPAE